MVCSSDNYQLASTAERLMGGDISDVRSDENGVDERIRNSNRYKRRRITFTGQSDNDDQYHEESDGRMRTQVKHDSTTHDCDDDDNDKTRRIRKRVGRRRDHKRKEKFYNFTNKSSPTTTTTTTITTTPSKLSNSLIVLIVTLAILTSPTRKPISQTNLGNDNVWLQEEDGEGNQLHHNHHQLFSGVYAFNIDTQSAIVHQGPAGSYFGYSVAQHRDRKVNYLLVGAPKAQTDQPKAKEAGAVYRCSPINPKDSCQQIPFDPNGSSVIQLGGEQKQSDDKSHQWFGASLQSATDNGSIVACAPRYVYYSSNLKRRDPVGTCWVSRGSFTGFLEYSPCRLNGNYQN